MNKIEKLINELCPDGVDFFSITELCIISRGRVMSKTYLSDNKGEYPVYSSQTVNNGMIGKIKTYDYDGEFLTWTTDGANAGTIFYRENKFSITNVCGLLKPKEKSLNIRYLYFILGTFAKSYVSAGMGNPKLMSHAMGKIQIPIPPIKIQEEIVKILDNFTLLEAELEAELEARKNQYEYYRDEMLSFGEEVEWKELGEVCKLITKGTTPKFFEKNGITFIKTEAFNGCEINKDKLSYITENIHNSDLKRSILQENDILFTIAGATIGKSTIVSKDILPANTNQALAIIRLSEVVENKYIFHLLQSNLMKKYISKNSKGSAQPNLNLQQINNFSFPFSSIKKQREIVEVLDKFDKLVNDISEGLPAEIMARKQQYEYYRGKLLDFKEFGKTSF